MWVILQERAIDDARPVLADRDRQGMLKPTGLAGFLVKQKKLMPRKSADEGLKNAPNWRFNISNDRKQSDYVNLQSNCTQMQTEREK